MIVNDMNTYVHSFQSATKSFPQFLKYEIEKQCYSLDKDISVNSLKLYPVHVKAPLCQLLRYYTEQYYLCSDCEESVLLS